MKISQTVVVIFSVFFSESSFSTNCCMVMVEQSVVIGATKAVTEGSNASYKFERLLTSYA